MPHTFRLYNTLRRQVEAFDPVTPGHIGLYTCGMTVYDHAHVGHARAFMVFDAFTRYLRHRGWDVTYVRNYTDVDDKIIRRAAERGIAPDALAQHFIDEFQAECAALGMLPPTAEPRVTTSMDAIRDMIAALIAKGHAYAAGGSVWFRVASYASYGELSNQSPSDMRASGDPEGGKEDPRDFALWKAAKPGEPAWDSPWGPGRPGWHIECSAMSRAHLGATFDIHGGGLDLVFPHHENEIAQSCCANDAPYARWWMHNGLLTRGDASDAGGSAKMGKSLGNAYALHTAIAAFPAEALRLYYLAAHYRSPLPWTDDSLPDALALLARLYEARDTARSFAGDGDGDADRVAAELGRDALDVLELGRGFVQRFHAALDEDFNTAAAMALAFELVRAINRLANHKRARKVAAPVVAPALEGLAELQVLGLLGLSGPAFDEEVKAKRLGALGVSREEVEALLQARQEARAAKDWARADEIREALDARQIVVMDGADGVTWKVRLSTPTT